MRHAAIRIMARAGLLFSIEDGGVIANNGLEA